MRPFQMLWMDIRALVVDTVRAWWRLLPQLLSLYLLGWLGYQLALKIAAIVADSNAWAGVVIFTLGLVSRLTAIVLMLRLVGVELGVRQMLPPEEAEDDDRDSSVTQLLALTLLPFLGIYAAFGYFNRQARDFSTESYVRNGVFGHWVLTVLQQTRPWVLTTIVLGAYLVRRGLDSLHERTGMRVLGLLVATTEAFFMLSLVLAGKKFFSGGLAWLQDRSFVAWLAAVRNGLARVFAVLKVNLPAVLDWLWHLLANQIWPLFLDVLTEPIAWLAVAALVYGSSVLSVADLWRRGRTVTGRLPLAERVTHTRRRILRQELKPPAGVRRVAAELKEAFLGDLDDKYLPTLASLRLVLRAGLSFLGAYLLIYGLLRAGSSLWGDLLNWTLGGHDLPFWLVAGPAVDLLGDAVPEPLRVCLLGVAFHRCLRLFQVRSQLETPAQLEPAPAAPALAGTSV